MVGRFSLAHFYEVPCPLVGPRRLEHDDLDWRTLFLKGQPANRLGKLDCADRKSADNASEAIIRSLFGYAYQTGAARRPAEFASRRTAFLRTPLGRLRR